MSRRTGTDLAMVSPPGGFAEEPGAELAGPELPGLLTDAGGRDAARQSA
ncbi:hypothetical protein [Streptantibioticus ferralitis]|uniref:Uncharacterized protein n=1 Tax=Streptantibioticus ferralitis TaxID=236510 RepID=A0ABT5YX93_9ACTN|nr:hypothetical protein [Streptantibioticus ferralitis]MDF2256098.1 hypothetical protein [Streptantibioticus ferralitis]